MKKIFKTTNVIMIVVAVAMLSMSACEKKKRTEETPIIEGKITDATWQLTKFVDIANDTFEFPTIPPNSNSLHYWIKFNKDSTIEGFGCANHLGGFFSISTSNININIGGLTYVHDAFGHEEKMCKAMNICDFFDIKQDSLYFYYNSRKNYLEFVKID